MQSSAIQPSSSYCSPLQYAKALADQLVEKIKSFIIDHLVGPPLRAAVFQLSVQLQGDEEPCAEETIHCYQRLTDGCKTTPIDLKRLEQSKQLFLFLGGELKMLDPADQEDAKVESMLLTSETFFQRIPDLGGTIDNDKIVFPSSNEKFQKAALKHFGYASIDDFCEQNPGTSLEQFLLEKLGCTSLKDLLCKKFDCTIETIDGQDAIRIPEWRSRIKEENRPLILSCHSPGRSYLMERKKAAFLLAGCDLMLWDPRGTINSMGRPTEAGHYKDALAVYQEVHSRNYKDENIWVIGYCMGAAVGAYIKREHPDVNFVAENPFTTLLGLIRRIAGSFFGWLAEFSMSALQDPKSAIHQNGFDMVDTLTTGSEKGNGKCLFFHSQGDGFVPENTEKVLREKLPGSTHHTRPHADKKGPNPHMRPPLITDSKMFKEFMDIVAPPLVLVAQ